jgi:cytochrome c peroxidase
MNRTQRIWICSVVSLKIPSRHLSLAVHFVLVCVLMQSATLAYELPLPSLDPSMAAAAKEPITPIPLHQAIDPRRVALGERLFNDVRLSHDNTRACTTCHPLERGGMDGQPRAIAANGTLYLRKRLRALRLGRCASTSRPWRPHCVGS